MAFFYFLPEHPDEQSDRNAFLDHRPWGQATKRWALFRRNAKKRGGGHVISIGLAELVDGI